MPMRPQKKRPPIIDGLPSPSVAKMTRMNIAELQDHIAKLTTEGGHLEKRIERLMAMQPPHEEQVTPLRAQLARLQVLIGLAQQHLKDKNERKGQWDSGNRPPRSGGFGGSGFGGSGGRSGGYGGGSSGGRGGPSRGRPRW